MRTAILDAWSGVAGDMWVGAMLDAGAALEPLVEAVASLVASGDIHKKASERKTG